jgi:hypothetical protein
MTLLGKTDRLVYVRRFYGMEMSVEKNKTVRISRQPSPVQIVIGQNELDIVEYFKYSWYVSNRQIHEDLGVPLFAEHIRALTASFDSKLADVVNPPVRQLGRYLR